MKIKIKLFDGQKMPEIINEGDWIDLRSNEDAVIKAPSIEKTVDKNGNEQFKIKFNNQKIRLGVAMKLPKGFEANVLPRSSTYKHKDAYKSTYTILANSMGIIDGKTTPESISYSGDNDEWKYNAIALNTCHIKKGQSICQFRIQLSQKATFWQKLRWLFSSKIELVQVDHLDDKDRGGFGTTDTKDTK